MWFGTWIKFYVRDEYKKVLDKIGFDAEVEHSDLASVTINSADLFVMGKDIAESSSLPLDKVVILDSIISISELEEKLIEKLK